MSKFQLNNAVQERRFSRWQYMQCVLQVRYGPVMRTSSRGDARAGKCRFGA